MWVRLVSFLRSEQVVIHSLIGIAVCGGCLLRVAMSGLRVFAAESNYSFQVFNVVGCVLMGFIVEHKLFIHDSQQLGVLSRPLYAAITSGLCGSITSFSTMQIECSKSFFLQWDMTWGNYASSHNGGRIFEFLICQLGGIATPIIALHVGYFLGSTFSPLSNSKLKGDGVNAENAVKAHPPGTDIVQLNYVFVLPFFLFLCTILLVTLVPLVGVQPPMEQVTSSCGLGILGAFVRFHLSKLNRKHKAFPLGTFIANVVGTWFAALVTLVSKFMSDPFDHPAQVTFYGLTMGFCGCVTTMSTFVKEIDDLSRINAYRYGLTSVAVSQVGVIFILCVYAFSVVDVSSVSPQPIDICTAQSVLCGTLLRQISCPPALISATASTLQCGASFRDDACVCGSLTLARTTELVVESQARGQVATAIVPLWPHNYGEIRDPSETVQLCLSHQALCSGYMDRIGCPKDLRVMHHHCGTSFQGAWSCGCGKHAIASGILTNLILDHILGSRYDLKPYFGHVTHTHMNLEEAFYSICTYALQHAGCYSHRQSKVLANSVEGNFSTWRGDCLCRPESGAVASATESLGHRVPRILMAAAVRPALQSLLVTTNASIKTFDMCSSYLNICEYFLAYMQCPKELRYVGSCSNASDVSTLEPRCRCGALHSLDTAPIGLATDALLSECIWTGRGCELLSEESSEGSLGSGSRRWYYLRETKAPYGMVIGSSPLKQMDFFL
jgi:fluoride ion exporter CrcB/FEX